MTAKVLCLSGFLLAFAVSTSRAQMIAGSPNAILRPPTDFAQQELAGTATHLVMGRSFLVGSVHRLTRVYVTNPAVLDAYTSDPQQVLITAKQPGVSTLVLWDETGGMQSYLISSDVNVAALRASLKEALPRENIRVQGVEGSIELSGTVSTTANADLAIKMAGLYSKDISNALVINSAAVQQVRLKVRIMEVDRSKLDQFGVNFFSAGGSNLVNTTTSQFPSSASVSQSGSSGASSGGVSNSVGSKTLSIVNALNFLLYSSKLNVGATIQDLESRNVLQILAEPTITALSGEKASFLAGGEFPFPVVQSTTGALASITVQFRPYGVRLDFTPLVNADNSIQLKVAPEVSALDYANAVQVSGYTIPALSTRRAETEVVLRSGQSFAISGLLDKRTTDTFSRTPGIANVPVLGKLFTSKSQSHATTELIVVVTPELVSPLTEDVPTPPTPAQAIPMLDQREFDSKLPGADKVKQQVQQ